MDEGFFDFPGEGSSLRLVCRSGAPRVQPFQRDASASFGRTNFPCAGPFVSGFHGANAHQCHPYTMTAQARTKRGLWGYLFMGRKVGNLNFTVIEIGAYPGLGAMDAYERCPAACMLLTYRVLFIYYLPLYALLFSCGSTGRCLINNCWHGGLPGTTALRRAVPCRVLITYWSYSEMLLLYNLPNPHQSTLIPTNPH